MKKLSVFLACILLAVPVFAGTNMIGADFGVSFDSRGFEEDAPLRVTSLDASVSGANYFGAAEKFGIGYALGLGRTVSVASSLVRKF